MKKKTVMRLFAVLMAAALATSSAPSTMFGLTDVVMADGNAATTPAATAPGEETADATDTKITVQAAAGYSYAIAPQNNDAPTDASKWKALDSQATETTITFTADDGVTSGTTYFLWRLKGAVAGSTDTSDADPICSVVTDKASIASAEITLKKDSYTYTGSEISLEDEIDTVKIGDKALEKDVDYEIDTDSTVKATNVGEEISVTIKGKGTYDTSSTAKKAVTIKKAQLNATDFTITAIADVTYPKTEPDANAIIVTPKTDGASALAQTTDYTYTCSDNDGVGEATVTITAAETGNYEDDSENPFTATYQIVAPVSVSIDSGATVSADAEKTTDESITITATATEGFDYEYALLALTATNVADTITWSDDPTFTKTSASDSANLQPDTEYTAFVRIKADANNNNTASEPISDAVKTAKASIATLTGVAVDFSGDTDITDNSLVYTGEDLKTKITNAVKVTYTDSANASQTLDASNYDVEVTGDTTNANADIKVTVKGKNNYSGSLGEVSFSITKAPVTAKVSDTSSISKTYNGDKDISGLSAKFTLGTTEYTISGLSGTLAGKNAGTVAIASVTDIASPYTGITLTKGTDAVTDVASLLDNLTITFDTDGHTVTVTQNVVTITAASATNNAVTLHYGESLDLKASNDMDVDMTYSMEGLADYLFDVDDDGTLKCIDYDTAKANATNNTYKIKIAFDDNAVKENLNYKISNDNALELTITLAPATPVITLSDDVTTAADGNGSITLSTTTTEADLKQALVKSVTFTDTTGNTNQVKNFDVTKVTLTYDGSSSFPNTISTTDTLKITGISYSDEDTTHFATANATLPTGGITVTFSDTVEEPGDDVDDDDDANTDSDKVDDKNNTAATDTTPSDSATDSAAADSSAAQTAASSAEADSSAAQTAAGSKTEVAATTNSEGNQVTVTTTTETDSTGAVIGTTTTSVIENPAANTTATVTVQKDASGTIQSADAAVSKTVSSGNKATLTGSVVKQLTEAAGTDDVKITFTVKDADGKTKFKVKADANDLTADAKLKIYQLNTKTGEYTIVNAKTYTVNKNGSVTVSMSANKTYELVTEKEAKSIVKEIKSTIKVKKSSATLKTDKTTSVKLSSKLNMKNVKSIKYSTSKKSVATVNSKGKITAKKAGSATIKAKVTLKDGSTKTVKMTVKVK